MRVYIADKNVEWTKEGDNFPLFSTHDDKAQWFADNNYYDASLWITLPNKNISYSTPTTLTVMVDKKKYPNATLNSNYAFVGNNFASFKCYFITNAYDNATTITYSLDEDIITNLTLDKYKTNKKIWTSRGHIPRFNSTKTLFAFEQGSPLCKSEGLSFDKQADKMEALEFSDTIDNRNKIRWIYAIRWFNSDTDRTLPYDLPQSYMRMKQNGRFIETGLSIIFYPIIESDAVATMQFLRADGSEYIYDEGGTNPTQVTDYKLDDFIEYLMKDEKVFTMGIWKGDNEYTKNISIHYDTNTKHYVFTLKNAINDNTKTSWGALDNYLENSDGNYNLRPDYDTFPPIYFIYCNTDFLTSHNYELSYLNPIIADIGYSKQWNFENEPKIHTSEFMHYVLKKEGEEFLFKPELIYNDEITITRKIYATPEFRGYTITIEGGEYGYIPAMQNGITLQDLNELPLKDDAYKTYMNNNKAQSISGIASGIIRSAVGGGVASTWLPMGTPIGVAGGAITGLIGGVAREGAKRSDLKNQKPSNIGYGTNMIFNYDLTDPNGFILTMRVPKHILIEYAKKFHRNGYLIDDTIELEQMLNGRHHFNYLAIEEDITNYIDASLSNTAKIYLNSKYKRGIRLWHLERDLVEINNYEYDNTEV